MSSKPIVICDIDGTLADGSHRYHYVRKLPKNWAAYKKLAHMDTPISPVVSMFKVLQTSGMYDMVIVTGRGLDECPVTRSWLEDVAKIDMTNVRLMLRPLNDYRADYIIKTEILNNLRAQGNIIAFAIDDRKQVKSRCWVQNDVFVFDVNQTDSDY